MDHSIGGLLGVLALDISLNDCGSGLVLDLILWIIRTVGEGHTDGILCRCCMCKDDLSSQCRYWSRVNVDGFDLGRDHVSFEDAVQLGAVLQKQVQVHGIDLLEGFVGRGQDGERSL